MTAEAVPTRGGGALSAAFVSWFGDSGGRFSMVVMLSTLMAGWRGRCTSSESNGVYFVVDGLARLDFSAEDVQLVIDDRDNLGRAFEAVVGCYFLPIALERVDGHGDGHACCCQSTDGAVSGSMKRRSKRRSACTAECKSSRDGHLRHLPC